MPRTVDCKGKENIVADKAGKVKPNSKSSETVGNAAHNRLNKIGVFFTIFGFVVIFILINSIVDHLFYNIANTDLVLQATTTVLTNAAIF